MDVTFIDYIAPLLSVINIFGVAFFRIKGKASNKATFYIYILPALFTFSCLFCLLYGLMKTTSETNYLLSTVAAIATTLIRAPNYYYYKNQLRSLILNINDMNYNLKIGQYNRKKMIRLILYLMLFSFFFGILDFVLMIDEQNNSMTFYYYVYSMSICINFIETYFMQVILKQIGNQFAHINSELDKNIQFINLDLKLQPSTNKTIKNIKHINDLKLKERSKYFKNTYQLADYHFAIIKQCKSANEIFALPSLYILGTEFTILVGIIQELAIAIHTFASGTTPYSSKHEIGISVYWSVIIMTHFYYYIDVYRFVTKEFSRTSTHIHHIWNTLATNDELDEQCNHLQLIAMQMLNNKMVFTARGLFPLDRTLLQRIINAIAVYVVILVQFYLSDQKKKQKKLEATTMSN